MFDKFPDARERFFKILKGNRIKLRKYPELIRAMYKGVPKTEIPEDLRVEENRHKSIILE